MVGKCQKRPLFGFKMASVFLLALSGVLLFSYWFFPAEGKKTVAKKQKPAILLVKAHKKPAKGRMKAPARGAHISKKPSSQNIKKGKKVNKEPLKTPEESLAQYFASLKREKNHKKRQKIIGALEKVLEEHNMDLAYLFNFEQQSQQVDLKLLFAKAYLESGDSLAAITMMEDFLSYKRKLGDSYHYVDEYTILAKLYVENDNQDKALEYLREAKDFRRIYMGLLSAPYPTELSSLYSQILKEKGYKKELDAYHRSLRRHFPGEPATELLTYDM